MLDITKEYLDKQLSKLATRDDIEDVKSLVMEEVGKLATMTANGFEEIKRELDLRAEVDQLKTQMKKVWDALHIIP